jgi:E3 ubiquitin-protein ligase NRDP1
MVANANNSSNQNSFNLNGEDILFNFNNLDFSNDLMQSNQEENEILEWSRSMPLAKVTRWGGIISTPDSILQNVIKRALIESRCPSIILNQLMENAHERQWPTGLNTLESRQINRNLYTNYICKRVPQKQAVLILACDNKHMPKHLVVEPGIILIFAHGVE